MKNGWFRFYSETISDRKLQRIARSTSRSLTEVIGFWAAILSIANDSPKRGTLMMSETIAIQCDDIADMLDMEPDDVEAILSQMVAMQMIELSDDTYRVTNWDERQYTDNSTERSRKYRKAHNATPEALHATLHATQMQRPDTDTDTDTDNTSSPGGEAGEISAPATENPGSSEKKPRARAIRDDVVAHLEAVFSAETNLPAPPRDSKKSESARRWWNPLWNIYEQCGRDADMAESCMRQAIQYMRSKRLTIHAPGSVEKIAVSIFGENGGARPAVPCDMVVTQSGKLVRAQ